MQLLLYSDVKIIVPNFLSSFFKISTFKMDVGVYLEPYSEYEYGYVNSVSKTVAEKSSQSDQSVMYDDGESTKVPTGGLSKGKKVIPRKGTDGANKSNTVDEIPHAYLEILESDYDYIQPDPLNTERARAMPRPTLARHTLPALPRERQQEGCCRRSPRFWCLLVAALSTFIVVLVVVSLTGMNSKARRQNSNIQTTKCHL